MIDARRTYAYLVSAVSLAAIFGALTWFLRDLLVSETSTSTLDTALQLAILIIAVPIYLGHWLWQQRLSAKSAEERGALGRRIYLYVVLTATVIVVATSGYNLAAMLVGITPSPYAYNDLELTSVVYNLIPIVLAVALWAYHYLLLRAERAEAPERGQAGTVRRLHVYTLVAIGATMVTVALVELLRWLIYTISSQLGSGTLIPASWPEAVATLIIYLPLWLICWRWANQLFASSNEERESVLRKFYLYAVILIGTIGTVTLLALLLAGIFRQLLDLPPQGSLEDTLAVLIAFALTWVYHSLVLREDLQAGQDTAQQAEMRRLYLYLVAGVGLAAWVGGVISLIWLFLDLTGTSGSFSMYDLQKDQLAYSAAAILAGLPLWYLAWRQTQIEAGRADATGEQARRSPFRKFYIYFFQFLSIMAVLASAIYVVSQGVNWLLTQEPIDFDEISYPLAVSVVTLVVWLFHWRVLQTDRNLTATNEIRQLEEMGILFLQTKGDSAIPAIYERLRLIAPNLTIPLLKVEADAAPQPEPLQVEPLQADLVQPEGTALETPAATLPAPTMPTSTVPASGLLEQLAAAQTIVAPSTLLALGDDASALERSVAQAMIASPARKLLLPVASPEWLWLGMEALEPEKVAQEAVETLRQLARGETVRPNRRWGCILIVLVLIAIFVLPSLAWAVFGLF